MSLSSSYFDDVPIQHIQLLTLLVVGLVIASLYSLLKLRDHKKYTSTTGPTPPSPPPSSFSASPPRVQRHDSIADVVDLIVYPIKSCAGISLERVALTRTGFRGDRMWMVVTPRKTFKDTATATTATTTTPTPNQQYQFLTQRECPKLALIQPKIQFSNSFELGATPRHDAGLVHGMKSVTLSAPSQRDITCPVVRAFHSTATLCDVTLWEPGSPDDANDVVDQGDAVAEWLSCFLELPNVRLVFRDTTCNRVVGTKYRAPGNQPSQVSFADGMQYLIASQTSLAELNHRIEAAFTSNTTAAATAPVITMDRFRPNIVVNRSVPFDEDTWSEIQIGTPHGVGGGSSGASTGHEAKVTFHGVKHCTRCVIPTTNQMTGIQTGVFSEPLTTLRTFRRLNGDKGKPLFGENLAHREDEWGANGAPFVSVGDEVYMVARKERGVIGGSQRKGRGGKGGSGCVVM